MVLIVMMLCECVRGVFEVIKVKKSEQEEKKKKKKEDSQGYEEDKKTPLRNCFLAVSDRCD